MFQSEEEPTTTFDEDEDGCGGGSTAFISKYLKETNKDELSGLNINMIDDHVIQKENENSLQQQDQTTTTNNSRQNAHSHTIFKNDPITNKMATLHLFQDTNLYSASEPYRGDDDENIDDEYNNDDEYKIYMENNDHLGTNSYSQDGSTSENSPNLVNNEFFNSIIYNDDNSTTEEIQQINNNNTSNLLFYEEHSKEMPYDSEEENTNIRTSFNQLDLEIEPFDSEEDEIKPKEQRSFHMYIPKTLTPKSNKRVDPIIIEPEKNEIVKNSHQASTSSNITNTDEIDLHSPESSPYNQQDTECDESSTKFKMLKRNSRWGDLLNKISKPGTYVPATNKHSKDAILKNKTHDTKSLNTNSKQDPKTHISSSTGEKKTDNVPSNKKEPKKTEKSAKTTIINDHSHLKQPELVSCLTTSQPHHEQSAVAALNQNIDFKQEKTLKNYFSSEQSLLPEDLFAAEEEESNQLEDDEEDGWGTFINRNSVYNPYNYEHQSIGIQQQNFQSPTTTTTTLAPMAPKDPQKHKISTTTGTSILSNFFLPKAHEEEKKRQVKEKIEKKKEDKKAKEVEELKLQELEEQLIFYKNENEKTRRLKDELQAERQIIECERSEFKRFMEEERDKFENYKQEENQKLKRERRILERNIKDQQQSLSRKDHEKEVNDLKEKIEQLTNSFKGERAKLKSNIQTLKTRNEQLQEKVTELEENLKKRELERIDHNFTRKKQKEDNSQIPPNNSSPLMMGSKNANVATKSQTHHRITPSLSSSNKVVETQQQSKPESISTKMLLVPEQSKQSKVLPPPYPNTHKLGLLKKTFKVSDSHFNITWEMAGIGEVITSKREVGKGKIEILYNTGRRDVEFSNGSVKKILPDRSNLIYFNNGDVKKTFEDGLVIYFFNNLKTTQLTYPTGAEMYKFSNNQIETHFPGGEKEVIFPDKTIKFVDNQGNEEIWFSDGTYSRSDSKN